MNHDESYLHIWNSTFSEIVGGSNFFLVLTYMSNCDLPQSSNRLLGKNYDRVFQKYGLFFKKFSISAFKRTVDRYDWTKIGWERSILIFSQKCKIKIFNLYFVKLLIKWKQQRISSILRFFSKIWLIYLTSIQPFSATICREVSIDTASESWDVALYDKSCWNIIWITKNFLRSYHSKV